MSTEQGRIFFEQFIDDYYLECDEHLGSARKLVLELEKPGVARDAVLDELLRNFHSIKGLSAMVGVEDVTQLSHQIEGYLRELKHSAAQVNSFGISQVLTTVNTIEQILNARRHAQPPPDITGLLTVIANVAEEVRSSARSHNKNAQIQTAPATGERRWTVEFRPSAELAARGITVNTVRERLASLGEVTSASPRILPDGAVSFEFAVKSDAPDSRFQALPADGITYSQVGGDVDLPTQPASPRLAAPSGGPANVVRVDMKRLDDLMRIVGELVISRFHLNETLSTDCLNTAGLRDLQDINIAMEHQLRELRETVIRTRMVPIGQIFERMRFVVRGLERETQKQVHVEISGQDTELDKVIVEKMTDPLLHIVRNCISHGIESADERLSAGKPAAGTIRLSASTSGDSVLVEVEDDGRGLDVSQITQRARSLGLLGKRELPDSKLLLDIICSPGFTTRDAADLTSGRGVGMAAVQSAVSELGGVMALNTESGKGTRFTIQLPLTLAITDSLLVTVERQKFAVPQASVSEVFVADSSSVTIFENNELVPYRGGVLPIMRLGQLFCIKCKPRKRIHILVIGAGANAIGFAVDRIVGQREVVVRGITDPLLKIPGVSGATEIGDGRPVLILDVYALIRTQRGRAAMENQS